MKYIPQFNGVFGAVEPGVLNIYIVYEYHCVMIRVVVAWIFIKTIFMSD